MSYGNDFINGFQAGRGIQKERRDREQKEQEATRLDIQAAADRSLRRELQANAIGADAPYKNAQTDDLTATTERKRRLLPGEEAQLAATNAHTQAGTNRTNTLTPLEAARLSLENEMAGKKLGDYDTDAQLARDVQEMNLEKARRGVESSRGTPMAKVTQNFGPDGKSRAQFDVPLAEFKRAAAATSYRSPYTDDIADLGRKIAEQQAEQDGGDARTGFLNLTSRKSVVDEASRKKRRLHALELQDMLAKGVIDQAEADRRATEILGGGAK